VKTAKKFKITATFFYFYTVFSLRIREAREGDAGGHGRLVPFFFFKKGNTTSQSPGGGSGGSVAAALIMLAVVAFAHVAMLLGHAVGPTLMRPIYISVGNDSSDFGPSAFGSLTRKVRST
jgi:hypothetical protein